MIDDLRAIDLRDWAIANRDMAPHIITLTAFAKRASTIVEFGVRSAVSTWAFLDGLPGDGRMWSVDIVESRVPPRVYEDPRWTFIVGDDRDATVRAVLPDHADLVFIDTSHEYEHTVAELAIADSFHPNVILMHDAHWDGVERALNELTVHLPHWTLTRIDEARDAGGDFSLAVLRPR